MVSTSHKALRYSALLVAFGLLSAWSTSLSAEVFSPTVTGVSNGAPGLFIVDSEEEIIRLGTALESGRLTVAADRQIMIFCEATKDDRVSGGVMIVLGPAELTIDMQDDSVTFTMKSGRLITSSDVPQADQLVRIRAGSPVVEAPLGTGETGLRVEGDAIELGFLDGSASLGLTIDGARRDLPSGRTLRIRGADIDESDADEWRTINGFDFKSLVTELSVRSAREARLAVQDRLLDNVIAWDKYAQAENITPESEANKPQPEIRQLAASVQANVQRNTNRGTSPQTLSVQGANEVPSLSPAAISVGGITAVEINNTSAANLLTLTQSRGLGFNGPAQLATPGVLFGTFRFIGPSGLGAR